MKRYVLIILTKFSEYGHSAAHRLSSEVGRKKDKLHCSYMNPSLYIRAFSIGDDKRMQNGVKN